MVMITLYAKQKKRHRCTEQTSGLCGGCFERTALKHVCYLGWNRSPAQVGCVRQVLGPGALGRPRGIRWRGRWEGGSGWGVHVNPWLIHVNVWQKPLQYCKVISLQLIKINGKKKEVGETPDRSPSSVLTPRKGHLRTQWKDSCLQARKTGLTRNQPSWHLDAGLLTFRTAREHTSVSSTHSVMRCYGDPSGQAQPLSLYTN